MKELFNSCSGRILAGFLAYCATEVFICAIHNTQDFNIDFNGLKASFSRKNDITDNKEESDCINENIN